MVKIEDLKKEVELLRLKIHQMDKAESKDKDLLQKTRGLRKGRKRAQRKIRFLTGKKLGRKNEKPSADKTEK